MVVHSKRGRGRSISRLRYAKTKASKKTKAKSKRTKRKTEKRKVLGKQKKEKISKAKVPYGIKVLIGYSALLGAFYLLFGLMVPTTVFLGIEITGNLATLINMAFVALIFLMVHGFIRRKLWSYKLALVLYSFSILNSIISLFFASSSSLDVISGLINVSAVITIIMNGLTAWYVVERKDYFIDKHYYEDVRILDKVFISAIYMFYFFSILAAIVIGFQFYNNVTLKVDDVMAELNSKTFQESIEACANMDIGSRDICYLSVATIFEKRTNTKGVCDKITDNFYRFTCKQAIS